MWCHLSTRTCKSFSSSHFSNSIPSSESSALSYPQMHDFKVFYIKMHLWSLSPPPYPIQIILEGLHIISIYLLSLVSCANLDMLPVTPTSITFIQIYESKGPRTEPCRTLLSTLHHSDAKSFTVTLCTLSLSQIYNQLLTILSTPIAFG